MIALAAANSPRIHEINPSRPSGIQFPAATAAGGNCNLSDGATFPGGIAMDGNGNGGRSKYQEKKKKLFFCLFVLFFIFRYQTQLVASFR